MSDSKKFEFYLDLVCDDVLSSLDAVNTKSTKVLDVIGQVADHLQKKFTQVGQGLPRTVDPLDAIAKAAGGLLKTVVRDVAAADKAMRQVDMSHLAKQADAYGEKIKSAQNEVAKLYLTLQDVASTDEKRAKIVNQIADTQAQIARLQQAKGEVQDMARLADSAKASKGLLTEVDRILDSISKQLDTVNKSASEDGMSNLERQAAAYADQIQEAQGRVEQLQKQLQATNLTEQDRAKIAERILRAQQQIANLQQAQGKAMDFAKAAEQAGNFEAALHEIDSVFGVITADIARIERSVRQVDMKEWERLAEGYSDRIRLASAEVKRLQAMLKEVNLTEEQHLQLQSRIAQGQSQLNRLMNEQVKAVSLARSAEETRALQHGAREAADAYRELGSAVVSVAGDVRNASAGVFTALTVSIGASAHKLAALSDETAAFRAVAKATEPEVAEMVETAKGLEGIKTTAAAQAAVALGRAGLAAKDATAQLGKLSDAAIATNEAMDRVSKIALSTNRAFGQGLEKLPETIDILVATANASDTSIAEIGVGMGQLASTANATNQTIKGTATAFALLQDAGLPASTASNALQNSLLRLVAPADDARKVINKLKLDLYDNGKLRQFADIMADMEVKMKGLSDVKRTELLKIMFDEVGANAILAYFNQTEEKVRETTDAINNFNGETERTADKMKESLGAEFRQLSKDFENLQLETAEAMLPTFKDLIKIVRDVISAYDDLSEPMKGVVTQGALFAAGAAGVFGAFAQLVISIGGAVFAYQTLHGAQIRYMAQNTAMQASNATTAASMKSVGGAASAASLGGLAAFAGALAVIVLGAAAVMKAFNDMEKALEGLDEALANYNEARTRTIGMPALAARIGDEALTDVQARDTGAQYAIQAREKGETIRKYQNSLKELARLKTEIDKNATTALLNELRDVKKELSEALGLETFDENAVLSAINKLLREKADLDAKVEHYTQLTTKKKEGPPKPAADKNGNPGGATDDDFPNDETSSQADDIIRGIDRQFDGQLAARRQEIARNIGEGVTQQATEAFDTADAIINSVLSQAQRITTDPALNRLKKGLNESKGKCWNAVAHGIAAVFDDINLQSQHAFQGAAQLAQSPHFQEIAVKSLENLKKDLKRGDVLIYPSSGTQRGFSGHAEVYKGQGRVVSDYGDGALMGRHYGQGGPSQGLPRVFRPVGSSQNSQAAQRATREELEAQAEIASIQQRINALKAKQAEIGRQHGTDSKDYIKLGDEIEKRETMLTEARTKGLDAAKKAEKERFDAAHKAAEERKKIDDEINELRISNDQAEAELLEDSTARMEASYQAEIAAIHRTRDEKLRDFKGTEEQRAQFQAEFQRSEDILRQKHNRAIKEEHERRYQELAQFELDFVQEGLAKQEAAIDLRLRKELESINKMQKQYPDEWQRLENLKTAATQRAIEDRTRAEIQAQADIAAAWRAAVDSALSDSERGFSSSFQQMVQGKQSQGVAASDIAATLKPQDVESLVESLGQGSAGVVLENMRVQLEEVKKQEQAAIVLQKTLQAGSAEYLAAIANENRYRQEAQSLQAGINVLQDDGLQKMIARWKEAWPAIKKAREEQAAFNAMVSNIGNGLAEISNAFGEVGRNISAGIGFVTSSVTTANTVMAKFSELSALKGGQFSLSDMSTEEIGSMIGLLTKAAATFWGAMYNSFTLEAQILESLKSMADEAARYEEDKELELARRKLEIRKQAGEQVLHEELQLIEQEREARLRNLQSQIEQNDKHQGSGLFGLWTPEDYVAHNKSRLDLHRQMDEANTQAEEQARAANQAHRDQQAKLAEEHERRISNTRLLIAQMTQDKIGEIEAQSAQTRQDIHVQYLQRLMAIIMAGLDPATMAAQLQSLYENYQTQLTNEEKNTATAKAQAKQEERQAELDAEHSHQEALLSIMKDGALKERAQLELNKKQTLANLDNQLETLRPFQQFYEDMRAARDKEVEGSAEWLRLDALMAIYEPQHKEYLRLTQERADAEMTADHQIQQSIDETAKKRRQQLAELKGQIGLLRAQLTDDGLDDLVAQGRIDLYELNKQEAEDARQARADYAEGSEELQQVLTGIAQKYDLQRAVNRRNLEKASMDDLLQAYEETERKKLEKSKAYRKLEETIAAEEKVLKTLRAQNAEYERTLQLIDERYAKLQTEFDAADRGQFNVAVAAIDIQPELQRGIEYLANEKIINGGVLDRSSKESQVRGLRELLDIEAQGAESKRKNEDYDSTDTARNLQLFHEEMVLITLRRARALQEAKADAKTLKEKSDLEAELADTYVQYQEHQKAAIDEKRKAERRATDELVSANNKLIEFSEYTANAARAKLDEMEAAFTENLKGVKDAFEASENSLDALIGKLEGLAPTLAAQAREAIGSINSIRDELQRPIVLNVKNGSSSGGNSYYNDDDSDIPVSQIPSRSKKTLDDPAGAFTVPGSDGKWYRTSSEMNRKIRGYIDGGVIPNIPEFENDGAIIRVSAGERILQRDFNSRLENLLRNGHMAGPSVSSQHIHIGNISRDVDLNKLDAVLDKKFRSERTQGMKRWGINGLSRI
ncbi:MAG: phage tail tape measure protein [Candidatus Sericytochromatia bacterium]